MKSRSEFELSRRAAILSTTAAALSAVVAGDAAGAVPQTLAVTEVAPGVFVARGAHAVMSAENGGHIANLTFVVGREQVAVIDTGGSARVGAALLSAVRSRTALPVTMVVNTHMHPDHVLGNAAVEAPGVTFLAHAKMARGLAARGQRYLEHNGNSIGAEFDGTRIVLPTVPVDGRMEIDLGRRKLLLESHPTAHTDNDLTVRDLETGTLIAGDLVFSEHIPTIDGSVRGWLGVLDALGKAPAERVVPGHGPASLSSSAATVPIKRYLETLVADIRALIKNGKTIQEALDVAARDETGRWQLSEEYHKRNVTAVFAELEWE